MSIDWHQRYLQQSYWTKTIRDYLSSELHITPQTKVLEIGCGTGVIISDFHRKNACDCFGIDNQYSQVNMATRNYPIIPFYTADSNVLPFSSEQFDIIICHYFLLWLPDVKQTLSEVFRTLKSGGSFLVFAEPDHAARIDAPETLVKLGKLQSVSLHNQGANIQMGRILAAHLVKSGLSLTKYGILGQEQVPSGLPSWWHSEWEVLEEDLKSLVSEEDLNFFKQFDEEAWRSGSRVLWIPTFYASCKKP